MSTIGCAEVVSVSASCSRCYSLTQSLLFPFPLVFHMFLYSCMSHCLSSFSIYSVARYLYLYALPLAIHPLTPLKSLPQLQSELQLKVITVKAHEISSGMHRVQKLYVMSLVMWTCQNNIGFSLYAVPSVYHIVVISDEQMRSKVGVSTDVSILPLNTRD